MRGIIGFCLLVSVPLLLSASDTDWFNDDWEDRADSLSEGELIWHEGKVVNSTSVTSLSVVIQEDSDRHGWVGVSQCHSGLAKVPAAQLVFEDRPVRNLKIEQVVNIEHAVIEGGSVQLNGVKADAKICVQSEQQILYKLDQHHWALISGPFQRRFLDGYYPMQLQVEVQWPMQQWRYIRSRPAKGPLIESEQGHLVMKAHFSGRLKTALVFQQSLK